MPFSKCFIILLVSIVAARPVLQTRDVKATGPGGVINQQVRFADAAGTAVQVGVLGPARKHSVAQSSPMGPLSAVYRDVLRSVREPCRAVDGSMCEIAIGSFGSVGEVQYDFSNSVENVKGRSTQVLVACRCVGKECNKAVLIRPINVFESLPHNATQKPMRKTCIYEAVGNGFTDCHAELLRNVRRPIGQRPEYTHGGNAFVYTVNNPVSQSTWTAQGQRGWTRDCLEEDVNSLPTATMDDFKHIQQNTHTTPPDNACKPPNNLVQYFQEADQAAGEACYATYEYAALAASHFGSQQDEFAIGMRQDSYMDSKPPLVSNTELALTCSAAGLGVIVLFGIYRTRRENADRAGLYLFRVVLVQILSFALESLPLHIALGQETLARSWESEFADVGGSLALGSDQLEVQGSAEGSVLVMTAMMGTVKYNFTRVSLVAGFTAAFDLVALGIIGATLLTRRRPRPPRPVRPFQRFMRFMRRYPPRETQQNEHERLELEANLRQQQILRITGHAAAGNIRKNENELEGMASETSTINSESSAGLSNEPVSIDLGADVVPPIEPLAHGYAVEFASPPEQTAAGEDGSRTSPEGMQGIEMGSNDPASR